MQRVDRRTALILGVAAAAAAGVPKSGTAQTAAPQGVSRATWGKRESMLPGYKSISMRDVIYQPGREDVGLIDAE
jgi:hypothetical protein